MLNTIATILKWGFLLYVAVVLVMVFTGETDTAADMTVGLVSLIVDAFVNVGDFFVAIAERWG